MSKHLEQEIIFLEKMVIDLYKVVSHNLEQARQALKQRDPQLAQAVVDKDKTIDSLEVRLEEECLKILALHRPVAKDLRYIISVIKINNDLERVGDMAKNIGKNTLDLLNYSIMDLPFDHETMFDHLINMLHTCIQALLVRNAKLVLQCTDDYRVILAIHDKGMAQLKSLIQHDPNQTSQFINMIAICRDLYRATEHVTKIGLDLFYMSEGRIVRSF